MAEFNPASAAFQSYMYFMRAKSAKSMMKGLKYKFENEKRTSAYQREARKKEAEELADEWNTYRTNSSSSSSKEQYKHAAGTALKGSQAFQRSMANNYMLALAPEMLAMSVSGGANMLKGMGVHSSLVSSIGQHAGNIASAVAPAATAFRYAQYVNPVYAATSMASRHIFGAIGSAVGNRQLAGMLAGPLMGMAMPMITKLTNKIVDKIAKGHLEKKHAAKLKPLKINSNLHSAEEFIDSSYMSDADQVIQQVYADASRSKQPVDLIQITQMQFLAQIAANTSSVPVLTSEFVNTFIKKNNSTKEAYNKNLKHKQTYLEGKAHNKLVGEHQDRLARGKFAHSFKENLGMAAVEYSSFANKMAILMDPLKQIQTVLSGGNIMDEANKFNKSFKTIEQRKAGIFTKTVGIGGEESYANMYYSITESSQDVLAKAKTFEDAQISLLSGIYEFTRLTALESATMRIKAYGISEPIKFNTIGEKDSEAKGLLDKLSNKIPFFHLLRTAVSGTTNLLRMGVDKLSDNGILGSIKRGTQAIIGNPKVMAYHNETYNRMAEDFDLRRETSLMSRLMEPMAKKFNNALLKSKVFKVFGNENRMSLEEKSKLKYQEEMAKEMEAIQKEIGLKKLDSAQMFYKYATTSMPDQFDTMVHHLGNISLFAHATMFNTANLLSALTGQPGLIEKPTEKKLRNINAYTGKLETKEEYKAFQDTITKTLVNKLNENALEDKKSWARGLDIVKYMFGKGDKEGGDQKRLGKGVIRSLKYFYEQERNTAESSWGFLKTMMHNPMFSKEYLEELENDEEKLKDILHHEVDKKAIINAGRRYGIDQKFSDGSQLANLEAAMMKVNVAKITAPEWFSAFGLEQPTSATTTETQTPVNNVASAPASNQQPTSAIVTEIQTPVNNVASAPASNQQPANETAIETDTETQTPVKVGIVANTKKFLKNAAIRTVKYSPIGMMYRYGRFKDDKLAALENRFEEGSIAHRLASHVRKINNYSPTGMIYNTGEYLRNGGAETIGRYSKATAKVLYGKSKNLAKKSWNKFSDAIGLDESIAGAKVAWGDAKSAAKGAWNSTKLAAKGAWNKFSDAIGLDESIAGAKVAWGDAKSAYGNAKGKAKGILSKFGKALGIDEIKALANKEKTTNKEKVKVRDSLVVGKKYYNKSYKAANNTIKNSAIGLKKVVGRDEYVVENEPQAATVTSIAGMDLTRNIGQEGTANNSKFKTITKKIKNIFKSKSRNDNTQQDVKEAIEENEVKPIDIIAKKITKIDKNISKIVKILKGDSPSKIAKNNKDKDSSDSSGGGGGIFDLFKKSKLAKKLGSKLGKFGRLLGLGAEGAEAAAGAAGAVGLGTVAAVAAGVVAAGAVAYGTYRAIQGPEIGLIKKLAAQHIIEYNTFGNSEILDWKAISQLPLEQLSQVLSFNDWDKKTKKRLQDLVDAKTKQKVLSDKTGALVIKSARKFAEYTDNKQKEMRKKLGFFGYYTRKYGLAAKHVWQWLGSGFGLFAKGNKKDVELWDRLEQAGIISYSRAWGSSEIHDWNAIAKLNVDQLQSLLKLSWDKDTKKQLESIINMRTDQKYGTKKQADELLKRLKDHKIKFKKNEKAYNIDGKQNAFNRTAIKVHDFMSKIFTGSSHTVEALERQGAIIHHMIGDSEITKKGWDLLNKLSAKQVADVLDFNDWDDITKKHIAKILRTKLENGDKKDSKPSAKIAKEVKKKAGKVDVDGIKNKVSDAAAAALAKGKHLASKVDVDSIKNKVSSAAAAALAKGKHLASKIDIESLKNMSLTELHKIASDHTVSDKMREAVNRVIAMKNNLLKTDKKNSDVTNNSKLTSKTDNKEVAKNHGTDEIVGTLVGVANVLSKKLDALIHTTANGHAEQVKATLKSSKHAAEAAPQKVISHPIFEN